MRKARRYAGSQPVKLVVPALVFTADLQLFILIKQEEVIDTFSNDENKRHNLLRLLVLLHVQSRHMQSFFLMDKKHEFTLDLRTTSTSLTALFWVDSVQG